MINIEASVNEKYPAFAEQPALLKKPALGVLRKLTRESEINAFLEQHGQLGPFEFIEQIFDYFNFSYSASSRSRANIPAQGRAVIFANHPIGSLDGLALLHLIGEIRRDVKIIANDMLMAFKPLHSLLLPLDNMRGGSQRQSYKNILQALENDEAVIVFPAGEVSRAHPQGVRDGTWRSGFLHFARKTGAPLLPIYVDAKNSLLFYSASMLFKPLGTALLAREMFNKKSMEITFRVGEPIPAAELNNKNLADKALIARLKKHLYKLKKNRPSAFVTERTIAHPEDRRALKREVSTAELLGKTRDNNRIVLFDSCEDSPLLREIGRLRELSFRLVGEGTGRRRDLDGYDDRYRHLVLWDEERLDIAGAYRLGEAFKLLRDGDLNQLYTAELFDFNEAIKPYLQRGLELGRSFVNPSYWGKASLDYLWQGIGAYLSHNPQVRYLIGPVSISASYPQKLKDLIVYYYRRYYCDDSETLAQAKIPYTLDALNEMKFAQAFSGLDRDAGLNYLQQQFTAEGLKMPVLYKQYAALFDEGGFKLIDFSIDPAFSSCIDGLVICDLDKLKANKRKRYLQN